MSYDPKYREWVENLKAEGISESDELYQVYRGLPVFRVKISDNPPQYRFVAPVARAREYDRLCEKIDQRLDMVPGNRVSGRTSGRDMDKEESDEITYFRKWQDCLMELEDMKRRETAHSSRLEELQVKVNEIGQARQQLQKEVTDLKSQLKTYEAIVADLKKKK